MQLAAARLEQERLEAEARRVRDAAHDGHLAAVRSSLSGAKVGGMSSAQLKPDTALSSHFRKRVAP